MLNFFNFKFSKNYLSQIQQTEQPQVSVIESERNLNLLSEENFPPLTPNNKIQELPSNITMNKFDIIIEIN